MFISGQGVYVTRLGEPTAPNRFPAVGDRTPPPRFLAGPRNDSVGGLGWDDGGRDGLAEVGRPPLDPSTGLRVSGPSAGEWIPALGGRNDEW